MPSRSSANPNLSQTSFAVALFEEETATPSDTLTDALVRETLPPAPAIPEYIPVFSVKLVRADTLRVLERPQIRGPRDIAEVVSKYLAESDREQMVSLLLDTKNGVIGMNVISIGDLSSALAHPREVFKAAILANAASIALAHNHPSGDPTPSPDDIAVTRRLHQAGELLGIELLDHVVIGDSGRFVSLKEKGYM